MRKNDLKLEELPTDEAVLRRLHLQHKIIAQSKSESESVFWKRLADFAASASAFGAVIAAVVAWQVATSTEAQQILEATKLKSEMQGAEMRSAELKVLIEQQEKTRQEQEQRVTALGEKEHELIQRVAAAQNALDAQGTATRLSGVNIEIEDDGIGVWLLVQTKPTGAKARLANVPYTMIFPGQVPQPGWLEFHPGEALETPCRLGPLSPDGGYVFVVVDFGSHQEYRIVTLGVQN